MKRFLIFAAIAPPLGFIIAFWIMLQIANWMVGGPGTFDMQQVAMLPTIYLVGLIPALLTAGFDHVLAKREMSYRIALTALFGYFVSYAPLVGAFRLAFMHDPGVLLLGIVGAVPAALCSWLSTERRQPVDA
ncbi:DUF5413 family protein [Bradyrhizobium sp. LjRoot220]|uniref:DUF5413 family protein n=1 Tax=Bradyrhizobium sp. LjRoot220 TaxID=3342284 RepID=UPI003ECF074D